MNKLNEILAKNVEGVPKAIVGFSQSVAFSHYNYFSAQLPIDPKTNKLVAGGIEEQTKQVFENIASIVKEVGHVMSDIVKITIFTTNLKNLEQIEKIQQKMFLTYKPVVTRVVVKNIPMQSLVQIEAVLTNGEGTIPNAPQTGDLIKIVKEAPEGNCFSHSVAFSHYNNLTTQLPIDPKTNKLVAGGIEEQTKQALANIKSILESMEVPLDDLVKVNIYVKSLKDKEDIKKVYKTFFPDSAIARAHGYFPAVSIIEVKDIYLGALVQIEGVVSHGDGTPPQEIEDRHGIVIKASNTNKAPQTCFSSQSVAFSHYNNISMQFPIDAKTNELVSKEFEMQAIKCLENIKSILENINHKMDDVVKLNIFVKDLTKIDDLNSILKKYFSKTMPAGMIVELTNIEHGALIQMDAVVSNAEGTPPQNIK